MGLRLTGSAGLRAAGTDALTVLDEGVAVGGAPGDDKRIFDFVGAGITATPDPNDPTRVEISVTAAVLGGGAPTQIDAGDAPVVGVAVTASHSDHQHGVNTGLAADLAAVDAAAAAAGVSAALPRADHKHTATTGIPVTAQGTANAAGISAALSRADHLHAVLGSMIIQGANNVAATATTRFLWPNYHDALAPPDPCETSASATTSSVRA